MARGGFRSSVFLVLIAGMACSDKPTGLSRHAGSGAPENPENSAVSFDGRDTRVTLGAYADTGWELRNTRSGGTLRAHLAGAQRVGRRAQESNDELATMYAGALGRGFDHEIERIDGGLRDRLRLPEAPESGEVRYVVELGHEIAGLRSVGGGVELLLANGTPALRINEASVADALGGSQPVALAIEGCAFDEDAHAPWRRPVTPPGASHCEIVARLPAELCTPRSSTRSGPTPR
jgi:hypothetical protein